MDQTQQTPISKKYWKFIIAFLVIIILAATGFFIWEKYFSPEAQYERRLQKIYEDFQK